MLEKRKKTTTRKRQEATTRHDAYPRADRRSRGGSPGGLRPQTDRGCGARSSDAPFLRGDAAARGLLRSGAAAHSKCPAGAVEQGGFPPWKLREREESL